jgi:uncharacterized membrane protein required for colicin V production
MNEKSVFVAIETTHQTMIFFIELIFGILLLFVIGKAILETIWGICLVIFGLLCHVLAAVLTVMAWSLHTFKRLAKLHNSQSTKHNPVAA